MDYQSLIQTNPIVQYAQGNGFQMSSWVNMNVLMSASVKSFEIYVYANTAQDSMFLANQLKQYIEMNPMSNSAGVADDVSIGVRHATLDPISQAYKTTMNMMTGMLTIGMADGGKESQDCGGEFDKGEHNDDFWITRCANLVTGELNNAFDTSFNI